MATEPEQLNVAKRVRRSSIVALVQHELHPSRLFLSVTAGVILGVIQVTLAVSMAVLIFSGELSSYASVGIGIALFASVVVAIAIALLSSIQGIVSQAQDAPAVIVAAIASTIAAELSATTNPAIAVSTVVTMIALTSILTGLSCFILGFLKLGDLVRFIPYPVIGGFLAGTGWLLLQGGFTVMTNVPLDLTQLSQLLQPNSLMLWVPGISFAVLLLVVLRRFQNAFVMPSLLAGAIAIFHLVLWLSGMSIAEAQTAGLLLSPFPEGGIWRPIQWITLQQTDWSLILGEAGKIVSVVLLTISALLLNSSGIELATRRDIGLNQELQAAGIGNFVAGLGGGIICFHGLGTSVLGHKIGAKSRLTGLLTAVVSLSALTIGADMLVLFPKAVLGGLVALLGLDFLVEWVYSAYFKLPKVDYAIVILILLVVGTIGFLEGVGVGLVVAIALFVINYSQVNVAKHTLSGATYQSNVARTTYQTRLLRDQGEQIYVLELQGFLFFGTSNTLLEQIRQRAANPALIPLRFVILDFRAVNGLDSSAVLSFVKLRQLAEQHPFRLLFTHLYPVMEQQLRQGNCLDDPDSDQPQLTYLFADLDHGIEWCENQILGAVSWKRRRNLPLNLHLDELFSEAEQVSGFMEYLNKVEVAAGETLFQVGDRAESLFFVESGQVTTFLTLDNDQTRRLQTIGVGNLVGVMDFYLQSTHQITATTDVPTKLYRLSQTAWQQMQQEKPDVANAFREYVIRLLSDRLSNAYRSITDLLR
ncbi:cyclic nucleotide-binding domain-containing protein [Oscillatoria sp. FACHB-1407]|uniref:SulP family inorganic anion transporter n=1 Tax=Oscillatoria sp. FACHB-1407 TaxID=2692847 RepID=UPI00168644AD|nr:SulP family inorganic anion transporter [Oscillatoria sp. FACHB-1407]MBD2460251.1 cyclic nucleotide-binding domain-containing protein [Oscillatoria sp. FACHB-1407]